MEPRRYLQILRHRWLIVATATLVTSWLTVMMVSRQPLMYESSATFLIRPSAQESEDVVRALDTLVRGAEITSTYATVVGSRTIRDRAEERLREDIDTSGTRVSGSVVTGTNVLEIIAIGPRPQAVHALAAAIGEAMRTYVEESEAAFALAPLDPPRLPDEPVGPRRELTVVIGALFGFGLGSVVAVLTDSFVAARRRGAALESEGPPESFADMMAAALVSGQPFSVGVMRLALESTNGGDTGGLDPGAEILSVAREHVPSLGSDQVAAYLGNFTFALLLPASDAAQTGRLLNDWERAVATAAPSRLPHGWRPHATVGIFHYGETADRDVSTQPVAADFSGDTT